MTNLEHKHPTVNSFNRTGQRFLWSDTAEGHLALYRWDPPAGYTPVLMLTHDPSYQFRQLILSAFTYEYPLPCGCPTNTDTLDNSTRRSPIE